MTDKQIHDEVLAELEFEPDVHGERIGVGVENGVVTLSGQVESFSQQLAAERLVERVSSAKAVVDHLEVGLPSRDEVSDSDLAQEAIRAVNALSRVPRDSIRITVREGHVLLEGTAEWDYQRQAVHTAIHHLRGVRNISNRIHVREVDAAGDLQEQILAALRRSGLDSSGIAVEATGASVILHGTARTLHDRDEAALAAWRAAGVSAVENRLLVQR